jgi:ABC-2 type transport system ATP-binding protein
VGLIRADEGEVLLDGQPLRGDTHPGKRKLGFVPQDLALYDELTARGNLRLFGALYGLGGTALDASIQSALQLVGLWDRASSKVSTFSGGMKRRLNIAAALLHGPELLLLDEPTVGVDPQSRNAIFENLESLRKGGVTLLYTTHYMEEAERLCDRIVIIDRGKVIADDTLRALHRGQAASNAMAIELEETGDGVWLERLRALPGVLSAELASGSLKVGLSDLHASAPLVLKFLADNGRRYVHFEAERPNLEALFLSLTGRSLRDA